jgi:GTPase SAR1 family protein
MKKSASTESSFTKTEYKLTVLGGGGVGKTGTLQIPLFCSLHDDIL